jgi:hypothetical protein
VIPVEFGLIAQRFLVINLASSSYYYQPLTDREEEERRMVRCAIKSSGFIGSVIATDNGTWAATAQGRDRCQ